MGDERATEILEQAIEQRLTALRVPRCCGGLGTSNLQRVATLSALAEKSAAAAAVVQAGILGTAPIVYCGTEEQQARWLPGWASSGVGASLAVTEPGSGGNVLAMGTTAAPHDDGWVLTGRKCWVGNSHIAQAHVVIARTGEGSGGLSVFVVEAERPGVSLGSTGNLAGLDGFSCGEIVFDDVRVPADNIVGKIGDGLAAAYATSVLDGRLNIAALAVGIAAAAAVDATTHATTRTINGRPLAEFPTTLARLGVIRSAWLTVRQVTAGAARLLDGGHACDEELINAKHVAVALAHEAVTAAVEVFAATGCTATARVQQLLADVQPLLFAAGTPDIQVRRLGEAAVGRHEVEEQWSARFRERLRSICPRPSAARAGGEVAE